MASRYAIRFTPSSGGKLVRADAYVRTIEAALEGLASMRSALAPDLARKHGWPVAQVIDALTFSIAPAEAGSLVVPVVAGGSERGAPLATDLIAQSFWRETNTELGHVRRGEPSRLSAAGAEAFARASAAAREGSASVGFAARETRKRWRTTVAITPLEKPLRKHAAAKSTGQRSTVTLCGQLISMTYDPPTFVLFTPTARHSVRMPSALREVAQNCWGKEVVVVTDSRLTYEGAVSDITAREIRLAPSAETAAANIDKTYGLMRGHWDSDAVKSDLH